MRHSKDRPTVLVFATGGTIGMRETAAGLAADPDFPDALDRLVANICRPLGLEWRINHLQPPIDSANADAETAPRIARAVSARVRTHHPRGVVILHGTDTLAYTAARLAFELADLGAPTILTGSQLPHGAEGSDAPANLSLAIRAAVRVGRSAPVSIAFGGELLPAVRATKHSSRDLQGFRAEIALASDAEGIPARIAAGANAPTGATEPARTVALRFTPGTTADDLRAAASANPAGIVLECYGAGNAPMSKPGMSQAVSEIAARIPLVAITQCTTGGADLSRYAVGREFAATGVIDGGDLTVEASLAKLGYLLDRGANGEELRTLMTRNLVGERN